ncbi:hypothetical protein BTN49_2441 [Candidatus Enterovibrio escicola]|uniref:Uncharacterized protein n=1 Tax=Candidatus Enterovibrio escicola TaxID=1927127 RepID=A0A2A5T1F1_9GAMM|nr:hypothetical protein BTN49_2441 [Candidatus Enterovibrio escacola]
MNSFGIRDLSRVLDIIIKCSYPSFKKFTPRCVTTFHLDV